MIVGESVGMSPTKERSLRLMKRMWESWDCASGSTPVASNFVKLKSANQDSLRITIVDFANPERIWLLTVCLALVGWAVRGRVIRGRAWRALGGRGHAPRDGAWITLMTCVLLAIALMRPRWLGQGETAGGLGRDVVLAVDVSRSMAVEDAVPNRLASALDAADSLLRALAADPASRAGVVAFAGKGVIRCPLTENLGAVGDALRRLKPGSVQPGGTDLDAGIEAALDLFQPDQPSGGRAIVIFSDGEDHENRWPRLAQRLEESGVTIHAVAIGDDLVGRTVPFDSPDTRLLFQGHPVESRRVDRDLLSLVHETGGTFIPLGVSTVDLGALYVSRIEPASRRSAKSSTLDRQDWFPVLLICALGLSLAASRPPVPGWPRFPRWRGREPITPKPSKPAIVAGLAMVALGLAAGDVPVEHRRSVAEVVDLGREFYQRARFDLALESFEQAARLAPDHAVPRYDLASTLFQLGRFDEARAHYLEARRAADLTLRAKIDFALGNTAFSLGDLNQAIASYDDCLESTARGPGLDSIRRDAAENRAFALERLKSLGPNEPANTDHTTPTKREPREDPSGEAQKETDAKKGKPSNAPRGGGGQPRPASGTHRAGGAGGSDSQGSTDPNRSPDDRLDDALDKIQDALDDRLGDESRPAPPRDDHKDW